MTTSLVRRLYEATGNLAMVMNVIGYTDAYSNVAPAPVLDSIRSL
jgi:hypothetical protein